MTKRNPIRAACYLVTRNPYNKKETCHYVNMAVHCDFNPISEQVGREVPMMRYFFGSDSESLREPEDREKVKSSKEKKGLGDNQRNLEILLQYFANPRAEKVSIYSLTFLISIPKQFIRVCPNGIELHGLSRMSKEVPGQIHRQKGSSQGNGIITKLIL